MIIYEKKHSLKHHFSFSTSSSVPPLKTLTFRKIIFEKIFPKSFFNPKTKFFSSFLCTPLNTFCQTIQYSFFMKVFLYVKKITWEKNSIFNINTLTRTYKYVIQNRWLKKHSSFFKKRFFQFVIFVFENFSVYPHWGIIPKQSTIFLRRTKFNEENIFSKIKILFPIMGQPHYYW